MAKILLVEDDTDLRMGLAFSLTSDGYEVAAVSTKGAALEELKKSGFDVIVMDCRLPDGNGFDLSREVKGISEVPILMLTAMDTELDEINALESGADDYMSKPFSLSVLKLRIKKMIGRQERSVLLSNGIEADLLSCKVLKNGEEIRLSAIEFKLLVFLMKNKGQVLSKEKILENIWDVDGNFVDENTVSVNIRRLRGKIEQDPSDPQIIKTVHGIGYIWKES